MSAGSLSDEGNHTEWQHHVLGAPVSMETGRGWGRAIGEGTKISFLLDRDNSTKHEASTIANKNDFVIVAQVEM